MTHISTVILDDLYVFHKGASKISKMTRYDEFINYFPVEKMAKIVKLCKNRSKSPFFVPLLKIKDYDIYFFHGFLKEDVFIGNPSKFQEIDITRSYLNFDKY